ncbi:MAG: serine/threonine protein kinase [Bacteroides sp.]|nr:serine/threonine protein kinase [Bacteroides sp.]MCM1413018.1 serine/threonine protein kinase [Bacteroides sp.]MCM1471724.1 serine/threonine protein kinase [Bacteroides sp.]
MRSPNHVYTIHSVLGTGGFGITYSATFSTMVGSLPVKAVVAIKEHFISADCLRDGTTNAIIYSQPSAQRVEQSRRDFAGEARRLMQVGQTNPNIVKVSEVFDANNTSYYVMEYLEGVSLHDYVRERGRLTEQQTLDLMIPVVRAVASLHDQRITHLDIKPSNIMIASTADGQPRPVLIDFGLSKHYNSDGSATSTINTQGYSDGYAPVEQYVGISTFSPASDVYSLAATMVYCLSGQRPPKALEMNPASLNRALPADISTTLRDTLTKALKMAANDRHFDAGALANLLQYGHSAQTTQTQATPTTTQTPTPTQITPTQTIPQTPITPTPQPEFQSTTPLTSEPQPTKAINILESSEYYDNYSPATQNEDLESKNKKKPFSYIVYNILQFFGLILFIFIGLILFHSTLLGGEEDDEYFCFMEQRSYGLLFAAIMILIGGLGKHFSRFKKVNKTKTKIDLLGSTCLCLASINFYFWGYQFLYFMDMPSIFFLLSLVGIILLLIPARKFSRAQIFQQS